MSNQPKNHALSEVFPLRIIQCNATGFRLTPSIDKELGNRLSFRFSQQFPGVVVIWNQDTFFILGQLNIKLPSQEEWKQALAEIQKIDDFKRYYWSFQWLNKPQITPEILGKLSAQIFTINRPFDSVEVYEKKQVVIRREIEFWSEIIELQDTVTAGITLTLKSPIKFKGTLANFFENHPERQDPDKVLMGLKVKGIDFDFNGLGTIVGLAGTVGEHQDKLIEMAAGSTSKEALRNAPPEQPLVLVKFSRNNKQYPYAMAALNPAITAETAPLLDLDYGELLKYTKITDFKERQDLLKKAQEKADTFLIKYGLKLERSVNSYDYSQNFLFPKKSINQTLLLFGNGVIKPQGDILKGLKEGGVFKRHRDFFPQEFGSSEEIKISVLKLYDINLDPFIDQVQRRLRDYKFESDIIEQKYFPIQDEIKGEMRVNLEKTVDGLIEFDPDILLVFLPESDRYANNYKAGSFYEQIYAQLLRRKIASQFIYEDTFKKVNPSFILSQIVPGILAKLGNLPFVLAEPLSIADYFIGLDISRKKKQKSPGTINACASIRLYGARGEFINYQLEGDFIEGEEIPQRFLEKLLPHNTLSDKTILIYRDGRFAGEEVNNLLERSEAINSQLILVECRKSQIPRLYNVNNQTIDVPEPGLSLKMSSHEAILVTTKVEKKIGLARPLRLSIRQQGKQVLIEDVIDTTLKLTLLHHGALKTPRLPMPLHGADKMAGLRLKGIYPSKMLEGDRQFWL
ncbi:Piwi domain-containing protein [Crocosphaera sp. XPORK-15E]|uniref:Piwi domain-containing protein n=1 Tax=Crocosphaera sp. XPORK-15E TaxID=3110247 RepID=UPI002B21DFE5|nr:Piwi domain-containing protein [Crocosphaera sp. XPORK-15E]MEA5533694.1 Piwi domain-containing protein [Crocosphaera sp. XPORK-15E]